MSNTQIQRVSPFIKPIHIEGGSFYTFSSAAEDLTFSFNTNSSRKFKFSKFALLNIPEIRNSPIENTIKFDAIPGAYNSVTLQEGQNYNNIFAESFQNYCLNLETMMLARDDYDFKAALTTSERIFFKWLKELTAIRFEEATPNNVTGTRYTEEQTVENKYERVVKYIGDLNFYNNYSGQANSYTEVYVHVPTEVGNFPEVYFKTVEDDNYKPGMSFSRIDSEVPLNAEYIFGRDYDDEHPASLDFLAYYDNPVGLNNIGSESLTQINYYKKMLNKTDDDTDEDDYILNDWWFPPTSNSNCYYTEVSTFGDPDNDDLALYKDVGIGTVTDFTTGATRFRRSKLDGISIDWDVNSYTSLDKNITSLIDVARSSNAADFEFNAVLVYYDIYDDILYEDDYFEENAEYIQLEDGDEYTTIPNTSDVSASNILATNLFGVLFLDNVESGDAFGNYKIPTFKKCRPNEVTELNGNSYGFKINMRLDTTPIDSGVDVQTVISDSNTLSMDIFADALNEMRNTASLVSDFTLDVLENDGRFYALEKVLNLLNPTSISQLSRRLTNIEDLLASDDENSLQLAKSKSEILELIQRNYSLLQEMLTGKTPVEITYNLDMLQAGPGISLDKSQKSKTVISTNSQNFNYSSIVQVSILDEFTLTDEGYTYETILQKGRNYLRISDNNFEPSKHVKLYIKDLNNSWNLGQIFRIYFENSIPMQNSYGNFNLYIYTDFQNKLAKTKNYSSLIGIVDSAKFEEFNNKPKFEIHCIDQQNFKFLIDYL